MRYRGSVVAAVALAALAAGAGDALAQRPGGPPQQQRQAAPREGAPGERRLMLERQVRARIQRVMRDNLRLTDDQLVRLEGVMQTYEIRRRELLRDERQLRISLREAMGGPPRQAVRGAVDEPAVAGALDSLIVLQRRRVDLMEAEQRELSAFLSPLQRAQYFAMQENLRRMLEEGRGGPGQAGRPNTRPNAVPPE